MTKEGEQVLKNSIRKAIWIRIAAAAISILIFAGVVLINSIQMKKKSQYISQSNDLVAKSYSAEIAHYNWGNNLRDAIYLGNEFTGSTDYKGCVLGKWIYGERGTSDIEEAVHQKLDALESIHKEIHESAVIITDMYKTNPNGARQYFQNNTISSINKLVAGLDEIIQLSTDINHTDTIEMQRSITFLIWLSIICGIITIGCMVSLVQYVMLKIVHPVLNITEESSNLSQGSLKFHVEVKEDNEIGKLVQSLEQSVNTIKEYVSDIDVTMSYLADGDFTASPSIPYIGDFKPIEASINNFIDNVKSTLSQLETISEQVSYGSGQVSNSAQSLAQGATEQASSVESLSLTTNEISKSATENAKAAHQSMEQLEQANDEVGTCNESMKDMVKAMDHINTSSQEIGKILKTIEDIAFQTNILALNAAVEAARAGAAGKGFAVVADEVRNLAAKSDEAAKATKELIESSMAAVENGNHIVSSVSNALQKTADLSSEAVSGMGKIASSVENEAKAIEDVTVGIDQISTVVQSNTATSQEQAAASEELSVQAQMLKEQLNKFKLQ